MKKSYTTIFFNNKKLEKVFNATLSNDFYEESLFGSRSIIEEQIPGRKTPYFYGVEYEPLEFEVILGMLQELDIYQIKDYIEMFYVPEEYLPMAFMREDGFITPTYYVISTDSPEVSYQRGANQKFFGTITLNFRCDAPYGYQEGHYEWNSSEKNIYLEMASMQSTNYVLKLTNLTEATIDNYILFNKSNNTEVSIRKIYPREQITIDGRNKRITAQGINKRPTSIYEDWGRFHLEIGPKNNILKQELSDGIVKIEIIFKVPRLF